MIRILFTLCLIGFASLANATTYEEMNQQVEAFEQTGEAKYAPASMKRVKAFQGAAMLAAEEQGGFDETTSNNLDKTIAKTLQALENAKNNALSFKTTFPELLKTEAQATKALVYHHRPKRLPNEAVQNLYNDAQKQMNIAISSTEAGKLNLAKQAAKKATILFNKSIDASISGIVQQSKRALSQASSAGAKTFAPRTWRAAEQALNNLEQYKEDLRHNESSIRPKNIGYALELAVYAQKLAIQAKTLSNDDGSFEKLILKARQERLNIAQALGMQLDYEAVGMDVQPQAILAEIKKAYHTKEQHQKELEEARKAFESELNEKLAQQRLEDQQQFQNKISTIKSAFSTKLEQETFESKRQKKVQSLFKKGEAEVISKLDGTLIIRAKKLKFGSSSSKIDGKYFEFLGRVKDALMLYPERTIHIEGHTDSSGDAKLNQKLSLARAEAVLEFLTAAGMDASRIKALGYGEVRPIATNMYKKGRAMNRRIDIVIQAP